jgi:hypothetical protein
MLLDVFLRSGFSRDNMRGQAYDGAGNMAGIYNGTQAHILILRPLAPYIHCASHCLNLAVTSAINSHPLTRDSVNVVHEIGVFVNKFPQMKSAFANSVDKMEESQPVSQRTAIQPDSCLVCAEAIRTFKDNFGAIIWTLECVFDSDSLSAAQRASASGSRASAAALSTVFRTTMHAFLWKNAIFSLLPSRNTSTDQNEILQD